MPTAAIEARAIRLAEAPQPVNESPPLERILDTLRRRTGHDLGLYKPAAIESRLARRLTVHHLETLDAYADYLERCPEEAELLFRDLLIGVTSFFRDENAFVVLGERALSDLLATKREPRTLRAWVAGCSSGEEAYSLAIVIHEVLERLQSRDVAVQIYATDIDKNAVAIARSGCYSRDIAQQVSPERLERFFVREDRGYRIKKVIRETVIFAQHDMVADPPFSRLDIVFCRNVLIYLQPVLQQQLLARFHYALVPGGLLGLGTSETVAPAPGLFAAVDAPAKIFRAVEGVRSPRLDLGPTQRNETTRRPLTGTLTVVEAAWRVILDTLAPPTMVVNAHGDVLYASPRTDRYLEPTHGKTNLNLFAIANEGLGPHLALAVKEASSKRRRVTHSAVEMRGRRRRSLVDLTVVPLDDPPLLHGLLLIMMEEVATPTKRAPSRQRRSATADLERELARTKTQMQAVVRDMEATRLQLETMNDKLQSANEELQSSNEEITTSKEELQSANEELMALNAELSARNDDLGTANDDLRNLLDSTKIPTLFLDNALRIKRFTSESTRIVNLIPSDIGRAITDITLKLDYRGLAGAVADVLDTLVSKEVQVTGTDGTRYSMRIHPYRTRENKIDGVVITFSDVTALRIVEETLRVYRPRRPGHS